MNPPPASQGIWFPDWAAALSRLSLKELERTAYRRAITSYLHFCRESRRRATVASAREFMRRLEGRRQPTVSQLDRWKAALNWFFKAGAQRRPARQVRPVATALPDPTALASKVPLLAATDLGGPKWERQLIRVLRTRHYQWRTEQAYRMWAGRFAPWLQGQRRHRGDVFQAEEIDLQKPG